MARELPMFDPPSPDGASPHRPDLPIALGGGLAGMPAADGSVALSRHPDWIKARLPSGDNYHDLKGLLRGKREEGLRLTVDTHEDLSFAREVFDRLGPAGLTAPLTRIITVADELLVRAVAQQRIRKGA
jgi:hypothetical protein